MLYAIILLVPFLGHSLLLFADPQIVPGISKCTHFACENTFFKALDAMGYNMLNLLGIIRAQRLRHATSLQCAAHVSHRVHHTEAVRSDGVSILQCQTDFRKTEAVPKCNKAPPHQRHE